MAQQKPLKYVGGQIGQSVPAGDDVTFLSVAAGAGGLSTIGPFTTSGNGAFEFGSTGAVTAPGNPTFDFGTGQSTFGGDLAQSGGAVALNPNAPSSISTSAGALTLTSAAAALWSVSNGTLTLQASQAGLGILNLRSFGTGTSAINISSEGGTSLVSKNGTTLDNSVAGTVEVNNSAGAINVGNDADAFPINVGTGAAARAVAIGNNTGATSVDVAAGTGGFTVGAAKSTFNGDVDVNGNLYVLGTTVSTDSENVLVADNHLYLNAGYISGTPVTSGLVVNYDPSATFDAVAAGGFTAGVAGVSNPTIATVGPNTFAINDIIQVSSASTKSNNGIFEVLSHAGNVLSVRGVGLTGAVEDFTQTQILTDATVSGVVYKVAIAIIRAGTDGVFETANGSTTPFTFTDLVTSGATTLQVSYKADVDGGGATITTDVTDGDVVIAGTEKLSVTATGGLMVGGIGAERPVSLLTTTFDVTGTGTVSLETAGASISIGTGALAKTISIGTGAAAQTVTVGSTNSTSQLTLQSGTGGTSITSSSNSATAINISALSGTTNIEVRDNATSVFTLMEGANTYVSVDTTDGNEAINIGQFLALRTAGVVLQSGEAINVNDVVTVDTNAGGGRAIQSDANGAGYRPAVMGVALNGAVGAGVSIRVVTLPGSQVAMNFDVPPGAGDQGSTVYLHTVAGQVSLTPTATLGETVYRVGILQNAASSRVIYLPQFLKVN